MDEAPNKAITMEEFQERNEILDNIERLDRIKHCVNCASPTLKPIAMGMSICTKCGCIQN